MAKITWCGEDTLHQKEDGSGMGPSYVVIFGGRRFDKGKAVNITDPYVIKKTINMSSFEVELTADEMRVYAPEPADETPDPETHPVRRPPGRPPKVKPDAIDSNAA